MKDLLNLAVETHGGLKRWSRVEAVTVAASITGEIWQTKSKPDYLKNVIFNAETKRERVTMDFPGQDKRSVFGRIASRCSVEKEPSSQPATIPKRRFKGMNNSRHGMTSTLRTLAEKRFTHISTHRSSAPTKDFQVKKFLPFRLTARPGAA